MANQLLNSDESENEEIKNDLIDENKENKETNNKKANSNEDTNKDNKLMPKDTNTFVLNQETSSKIKKISLLSLFSIRLCYCCFTNTTIVFFC